MVADIITHHQDAIAAICRRHRVVSLWVFGSVTTPRWNPETSDVDVLADLGGYEPGVADRFLDLADDLEALLERPVDLLTVQGLAANPRLERRVLEHRVKLYDAERDPVVA